MKFNKKYVGILKVYFYNEFHLQISATFHY